MRGQMKPYEDMTPQERAIADAILRRLSRRLHDVEKDYEERKANTSDEAERALKDAGLWVDDAP